ncbi:hypothetical protein BH11PSE14_BH11PSE14_09110 [soil metagenome]
MNRTRNVSATLRGLLALTAVLVNAPTHAQADCQAWDLNGHLTLIQTNDTAASVELTQMGNNFSGHASFGYWRDDDFWLCNIGSCGKDYIVVSGPVVGTVNGDAFEATIYWNDNAVGIYSGRIGPQGLIVGSSFDRNDPGSRADWHSNRVLACASAPVPAKPALALGRVKLPAGTTAPAKSICDYAKSARERNSPAAPGLERQCAAQGGPPAPKALGRVKMPDGTPPSPPRTMCEMAASARARNSPTAPALEQRCAAEQAAAASVPAQAPAPAPAPAPGPAPDTAPAPVPVPAPAGVLAVVSAPVQRPQDLVIGRLDFSQEGQRGKPMRAGTPVAIECTYSVNEVRGPFVFKIHAWQGNIQIGGQVPQTTVFQGDPQGGQHVARQIWTPTVAGRTPISCVLNPGFEDAEANPGNNRWNEIVTVIDDGAPPAQ